MRAITSQEEVFPYVISPFSQLNEIFQITPSTDLSFLFRIDSLHGQPRELEAPTKIDIEGYIVAGVF